MFDEVDFFLPEALADDLKYTDLSKRFGPWEKETDRFPRPKNMRPVIFKLAKATNIKTIQMQVRSDNSPEMTPNKIWKIEIVQTSKLLKDKGL